MLRTQTELACDLAAARAQTDSLFELVRPDALFDRPIAERHRIIFYLLGSVIWIDAPDQTSLKTAENILLTVFPPG